MKFVFQFKQSKTFIFFQLIFQHQLTLQYKLNLIYTLQ